MGRASRRARQEAQEQTSPRRTGRNIGILVALAAGVGVTYGISSRQGPADVAVLTSATVSPAPSSRQILQEAYKRALDKPGERQTFLDLLAAAHPIPSCERIVYDPGFEQCQNYNLVFSQRFGIKDVVEINPGLQIPYAKTPCGIKGFGRSPRSQIFVTNHYFDQRWSTDNSPTFTLDDLTSTIIDHEGQHLQDFCEGITLGGKTITYKDFPGPLYPDQFFGYLKESRAYYGQIKKLDSYESISPLQYANALQQGEREIAGLYMYAEGFDPSKDLLLQNLAKQQLAKFIDIKVTYLFS